jgi:hypothetical protein
MERHPDPQRGLVHLNHPNGCIFEANRGVPLYLLVTKLQSEELKVCSPLIHPPFSHKIYSETSGGKWVPILVQIPL